MHSRNNTNNSKDISFKNSPRSCRTAVHRKGNQFPHDNCTFEDIPIKKYWGKPQSAVRVRGTCPISDEDMFKDLVLWISTIPLSTKKSDRTDRAFCDGVLIAEIIAHHAPHICDRNQFFRAYSSTNKLVNWNHLNMKVFPLLGFKVKELAIKTIINSMPFQGYDNLNNHPLYKLLFKLQDKLGMINPSLYDYRKRNSEQSGLCCRKGIGVKDSNTRFRSEQPTRWNIESQFARYGTSYFRPSLETRNLNQKNWKTCSAPPPSPTFRVATATFKFPHLEN